MNLTVTQATQKTNKQLIKDYGLKNNPKSFVNDFVIKMKKVRHLVKTKQPQDYKEMMKWSQSFYKSYQATKAINDVSTLHYMCEFIKDLERDGIDVMSTMMFAPEEFQVLFARHFVSKS